VSLEILQFIPGRSLLHQLNPVTKVIMVILIVGMSVVSSNIPFLIFLIGVIFLSSFICGMQKELMRQIPFLLILGVVLIFLTVLTIQAGDVMGYFIPVGLPVIGGSLPITLGGFTIGLLLWLRFVLMILAFQLFIITTKPSELVTGLLAFHMPVDYVLMLLIAFRFIPSLQLEAKRIHEAQLCRGYNPGTGFSGKIRSMKPIMIPLMANSLAKTQVIGLTLDIRGYRSKKSLPFHELEFHRSDLLSLIIIGLIVACFVLVLIS
jgi:energy-coupling factor transport system permease protein